MYFSPVTGLRVTCIDLTVSAQSCRSAMLRESWLLRLLCISVWWSSLKNYPPLPYDYVTNNCEIIESKGKNHGDSTKVYSTMTYHKHISVKLNWSVSSHQENMSIIYAWGKTTFRSPISVQTFHLQIACYAELCMLLFFIQTYIKI
jgi:hypothetical protein